MSGVLNDLAGGLARWRISYKLAVQDIELRYKRSVLGPFWISAALIATILALAYVFSAVFQNDFTTYIGFVATGLLTWFLIVALVNEGCNSVIEHSSFLQNVPMPVSAIAGRIVVRNALVFAHNFVAVLGLLLLFGVHPTATIAWALPGVLVILFAGFFLIMALGPVCARYRDVPMVIQSAMQVMFFLTPIFWMPTAVSHRPMLTDTNPLYHLVELVRAPMLGSEPTALNWQVSLLVCAVVGVLGLSALSLTRKRLALWL